MDNAPAIAFITRLYSATVPNGSIYGKKYVNRANLTARCVYTLWSVEYNAFNIHSRVRVMKPR